MRKSVIQSFITAFCGFALCGCIVQNETTYRNPEREKVEFENESAARIFYEALSKMSPPSSHDVETSFEIPVVMRVHNHVTDGENVRFNAAVKECDTNRDGKISELEARIFADRHHK